MPIEPNVPQSKPSRDQTSDLAPTLAQTVTSVELRGYRETDEPEPIEDIETTESTESTESTQGTQSTENSRHLRGVVSNIPFLCTLRARCDLRGA